MSEKLKPCPFCGAKPVEFEGKYNVLDGKPLHNFVIVHEPGCWVAKENGVQSKTRYAHLLCGTDEDFEAWNTRALADDLGTLECYECHNGWPMVRERTCRNVSEVDYGFKCSLCGDWEDIDHPKYCAHCGAKVVK